MHAKVMPPSSSCTRPCSKWMQPLLPELPAWPGLPLLLAPSLLPLAMGMGV